MQYLRGYMLNIFRHAGKQQNNYYRHERHVWNNKYKTNSSEYWVPSNKSPIVFGRINTIMYVPKIKKKVKHGITWSTVAFNSVIDV